MPGLYQMNRIYIKSLGIHANNKFLAAFHRYKKIKDHLYLCYTV